MRSQRLVSCMLLLQGKPRLTARKLAASLEVSVRTVYRDIEALSEAGVPVHMERGPLGGVVLADDYRRALAQFTNDELQALFAAAASPMMDLGIMSHPRALQKLAGALPAPQRRAAEASRDRLLLDHNRWGRSDPPTSILVRLRAAIADERCVLLRYRDRSGAQTQRILEPLGLVAKAGVWYLIANEPEKGYRTFRAERIAGLEELDRRFARPADFNLEAHWNSSVASIEKRPAERYEVVVRAHQPALAQLTSYWEWTLLVEDADVATVRIGFPNRHVAISQIASAGESIQILEPADLQSAIVGFARSLIEQYDA
jgi:predicted DNA-binding transcriptional regulator YafY